MGTCISLLCAAKRMHGPPPDTLNCGFRMRREYREWIPRHIGLAILTCIMSRAWRTFRDACRDRLQKVSFEVSGGENDPGFPGACTNHNFTYLIRGSCWWNPCTWNIWNYMIRNPIKCYGGIIYVTICGFSFEIGRCTSMNFAIYCIISQMDWEAIWS